MKKKNNRMPIMVLATICFASVGVLTACNNEPAHTHSYTAWNHNDTQHWKECPEDHDIDESTRENHQYVVGECECGATEPVATVKYGKITGKVKLHKQGTFETDYKGVNIDLSDDGAELDFNTTTGVFTFDNVKVGENHILTITKSGYKDYTVPSVQVEENETATIGGDDGIVLEYDVFGYIENYDPEYHDFSKVNEENSSIIFKEHDGDKTLNVLTKESFTNVSASFRVNWNNSTHVWHTQGIVLKFEDGRHAIIRYHNGDQENGNIQYANSLWDSTPKETSIFVESIDQWQWGEKVVHTLLPSETNAIKNGEGLDLTVVVNNGKIYTYFADNWVATYSLPEDIVGKKVQVGYFSYNAANNAVFNYKISEAVQTTTSTVKVNVNKPADLEAATANVVPNKESCEIGEKITLSITKPVGYKLETLLINNIDMVGDVVNNELTFTANRSEMNVEATFVKEAPIAINIMMKGKKFGKTAKLAENTVVTFKNTNYSFSVNAEGKIVNNSVVKGKYTVVVDGYLNQEIMLDENLQEIVLEYDAFKVVRWDTEGHDFSHVNEENPYVEWNGHGASLNMISKQKMLGDAMVSVTIKGSQTNDGDKQQGILLTFEDNKAAILNINTSGTPRLQFRPNLFTESYDASIGLHTAFNDEWVEFKSVTAEEVNKYNSDAGIELKVVRNGSNLLLFLDERYIGTANLPSQYADDKMGFGLFGFNVVAGSKWYFDVSENFDLSVAITDTTAADANGSIEISENVKYGDTVTVTVKPEAGYMLDQLIVSGGVTPTSKDNNTYTFVAAESTYTVAATFKEVPAVEAEANVTGIGLNAASVDMNGKEITFKPDTGIETKLTVTNGKVKGVLAAGNYTVSCEGFYDLTAVVTADGSFATDTKLNFEKIIFEHNILGDGGIGDANKVDYSHAAPNGYVTVKEQTDLYAFSNEFYDDVAFTATFKKDANSANNQGIFMAFGRSVGSGQQAIGVRFENNKAQFLGDWLWGLESIGKKWDFGPEGDSEHAYPMNDALLAKYNSETGLRLTLARKGSMAYVLIDGEVYAAHLLGDYGENKVCFGIYVPKANPGYQIPFEINTNVDSVLNNATDENNILSALGKYETTATTLAVKGNGYAEFSPWNVQTKESLKINIAAKYSNAGKHTQGLTYRFDNGKWLGVRIESDDNGSYIQYTQDALLPSGNGYLKGWSLIHNLTDEEKAAFNGDGIDLQLVRDGKNIYVLLGGNVIDQITLGEEYSTMDGVIAATIENATGVAYAYEYKAGEGVVAPVVAAN